jgi:hypothetical protein
MPSVSFVFIRCIVMLIVIILSDIYGVNLRFFQFAEMFICKKLFLASISSLLTDAMLNVIMLIVIMQSDVMVSVAFE